MKKDRIPQSRARDTAFTLVELLFIITVIGFLVAMVLPAFTTVHTGTSGMLRSLNNERQLQLATQQMALDATTTGDTNIGWPGDVGGTSVHAWVTNLVPTYMQTNDVLRLFEAPGIAPITDISGISGATIPFFVYPVQAANPSNTIFIITRNWGGFASPLLDVDPYHRRGMVVFHTGGDGEIFYNKQACTATNGGVLGETNGLPPLR